MITTKGREALKSTIEVVKSELALEVVYGDTDSIFVNTKKKDYQEAMQIAQQIKRSVNKKYKKLEIDLDDYAVNLDLGAEVVNRNSQRTGWRFLE